MNSARRTVYFALALACVSLGARTVVTLSAEAYDAVYFRPFNFRASDPVRHAHAVQYVSEPDFPWQRLRSEHPDQYEKPVEPAPDPNGWFHARVVVSGRKVRVFVNGAVRPSLEVDTLTDRSRGRVGLWVGEGSGGLFANLKILPQ